MGAASGDGKEVVAYMTGTLWDMVMVQRGAGGGNCTEGEGDVIEGSRLVIVIRCNNSDGDGVEYGDGLGGAVDGNCVEGEDEVSVGDDYLMRSSHPTVVGETAVVVRRSNQIRAKGGGDGGGLVG